MRNHCTKMQTLIGSYYFKRKIHKKSLNKNNWFKKIHKQQTANQFKAN